MKRFSVTFIIVLTLFCEFAFGQGDQKENSDEKLVPRMTLMANQRNGDSVLLQMAINVRKDGSVQLIDYEPVEFYLVGDSTDRLLGTNLTDDRGMASLWIDGKDLLGGTEGTLTFKSLFAGKEGIEAGEVELSIKKAEIKISADQVDSNYQVKLNLYTSGAEVLPLSGTSMILYVKRYFSNLKIGEGTTDENGEVVFDIPLDLPGDQEGNILLIGQAEDLEEYGNVSATIAKPWGIPRQKSEDKIVRALWSHAPPIWMLIVFGVLMSVVWGHYFVIIYKFIKLRKQ